MQDNKDTKKKILEGAFRLFLQKNYEKVTIVDIEKSINLTRGAIFYHTRNKEELFIEVINTYIINTHDTIHKFKFDTNCTLKEFIDNYILSIHETMNKIRSFGIENVHQCYFSLIYQALKYYPGFGQLLTETFRKDYELWYSVVLKAYTSQEIKQDLVIESVAKQFRYIYSGLSFEHSLTHGLDITALRQLYYDMYNQIKNVNDN